MCRQDICINEKDFHDLVRTARMCHPTLAAILEESKEVLIDQTSSELRYIIRYKKIDENEALDFLYRLMDDEQYSETREELIMRSNLVEQWRPIAEGPLLPQRNT